MYRHARFTMLYSRNEDNSVVFQLKRKEALKFTPSYWAIFRRLRECLNLGNLLKVVQILVVSNCEDTIALLLELCQSQLGKETAKKISQML